MDYFCANLYIRQYLTFDLLVINQASLFLETKYLS
jgi:hypothetical protein